LVEIRAIECQREGKVCLECTISDNGPGFLSEDFPRLFEPFFSRRPHGSGLGLAVSQGIVKDHDGWIEVVPREGGGTVFTVFLPVHTRARTRFETPIETVTEG
jgi:two-component system sensor histidine kinase FlrB